MTNFIYNMQDELFDLNMVLPVGRFSVITKLVDHIEAQGKQLRELNAAITKRNATIGKYEREKKERQKSNNLLAQKVNELNEGIRDSEDLTWKQKYDALLQSSEQAIGALQKKCQEYKNSESSASKTRDGYISELENEVAGLKKELAFWKTDDKRSFFGESFDMHSIYDLNRLEEVIADKIKSYDSKLYSLMAERDKYKESSETYRLKLMAAEKQRDERIKADATANTIEENFEKLEHNYNELINQRNTLYYENKKLERSNLDLGDTIGLYAEEFKKLKEENKALKEVRRPWGDNAEIISAKTVRIKKHEETIKKLKRDNDILRGKVNEISNLAESILMLCDDEE